MKAAEAVREEEFSKVAKERSKVRKTHNSIIFNELTREHGQTHLMKPITQQQLELRGSHVSVEKRALLGFPDLPEGGIANVFFFS